jgi:hypothetical protein
LFLSLLLICFWEIQKPDVAKSQNPEAPQDVLLTSLSFRGIQLLITKKPTGKSEKLKQIGIVVFALLGQSEVLKEGT